MPEPIAVAFVEVRPDVDEFKGSAERDLTESLGPVNVQGQLRMQGLQEAKADVGSLTRDLQGISGQQLQFPGLEDARLNAVGLAGAMRDATDVSVRGTFEPLLADVGRLRGEAEQLSAALSGLPTDVALDAGNIGEAADQTALLADAQAGLGDTLGTSATAASALIARYPQLVRGEAELAAATAAGTVQARAAAVEEEKLARIRARRAGSVGPFRLAGVGLGVGVGLFAATRAVGDLAEGLRVSGAEASTFEGKMRNLGASLLSGDIVGGIRALTDQTRDYNLEQLRTIAQSPKVAAALKEIGRGGDIARAQQAQTQTLTQVPQFLQTRIAGAQLEGDTGGEIAALERADQVLRDRIKTLRGIGLDQQTLNVALEEVFRNRKTIRDQIDNITSTERPDILGPLVERVTDARLAGDSAAILRALRAEAATLNRVIASSKTNAADRRKFKDELVGVHRDIEATQAEIQAEEDRHRQAMISARLAPSEEAIVDAQLGGGSQIGALQERAAAIQSILSANEINGKKLTRDERIGLKNELVSVHGQIESAQGEITAENQRHADAMTAKLAEADQAFLRSVSRREGQARNRQLVAQASAGLADDIRVSNELQAIFQESIAQARKRITDAKTRADTIASLTSQLLQEQQGERGLRQQQRRERVDAREESLDLDIQLAQANENERIEIRAHRAKIRFLRERIRHTREGTNQRKRLILEVRQEQAAIRELLKADQDTTDEQRSATTLADLFSKQVDIGRGRSIDSVGLAPKPGDLTQPIENAVTQQIKAKADLTVQSPFDRRDDKVVTSQEKLTAAIERLTATIPNLTGSVLPGTGTGGVPVEGLRWQAAARFWESERGKQLARETASA